MSQQFQLELVKLVDTEVIEFSINAGNISTDTSLSFAAAYNFTVQMNIEYKYVRVFFTLDIKSFEEQEQDLLASAITTIAFGFEVANLAELASDNNGARTTSLDLLWNLFGIVYDRSGGVITGLSQGTYLQDFIMPILTPEALSNIISKGNGFLPN